MLNIRIRYSLRTLFVLMTVLCLAAYGLARPSILAHRFLRAVAAGEHELAESLFIRSEKSVLVFPGKFGTDEQIRNSTILLTPLTLQQLFCFERHLSIDVPYGSGTYEMDAQLSVVVSVMGLSITYWIS